MLSLVSDLDRALNTAFVVALPLSSSAASDSPRKLTGAIRLLMDDL